MPLVAEQRARKKAKSSLLKSGAPLSVMSAFLPGLPSAVDVPTQNFPSARGAKPRANKQHR
jgi:hypothetical protein